MEKNLEDNDLFPNIELHYWIVWTKIFTEYWSLFVCLTASQTLFKISVMKVGWLLVTRCI